MTMSTPRQIENSAAATGTQPHITRVELIWQEKEIEFWLRFGHPRAEQIVDAHRRVVGFAPGAIFAFVRWHANEYGTIASHLTIACAVRTCDPCQSHPFIDPGAEILLKLDGWPRVTRALEAIDVIEAMDISPEDVAPDHWRHLHHRLAAREAPRGYSRLRHAAWLKRRELER